MSRFNLALILAGALATACVSTDRAPVTADSAGPIDVEAWRGELPIKQPWLRSQLPAGALTYERIPHPLGLIAMPKGNILDAALGSAANIQNLFNIQQSIADELALDIPPARLLENLQSPLEIAVMMAPAPSGLIGSTLSFRSNADFEAFVAELSELLPVQLAGPLDENGYGQLVGAPIPIHLNFDAQTGRFAVFASPAGSQAMFAELLASDSSAEPHPMHALEQQIDESGQGLFGWINVASALQAGAFFIPPEIYQTLQATGVSDFQALAFGSGVAQGKGRLKLVADLGVGNANRLVPIIRNEITATSVGQPKSLLLFSIPGAQEFARLENAYLTAFAPDARAGWEQMKAGLAGAIGVSIEDLLAALGPEIVAVNDRAGGYLALHVRDHLALDVILDRWSEMGNVPINDRSVNGQQIRYVALPGAMGMAGQAADGEAAQAARIIGRMRTRLYWVEDGDYLYLSSTPQPLIDRIDIGADSSVAEWLDQVQRIDVSSSLLAATGSAENLPQYLYNGYIGMMQSLADLVGAQFDVWSMPTANQLRLPSRGTLGFSVSLGEPFVSLELSYESNPAELLMAGGGGMGAAAVAGVVAAIALPAYQDYTIRAHVSEGLNLAAAAKAAVEESYVETGTVPADRVAAGLSQPASDTQGRFVESVNVANGNIVIRYGNAANSQIDGESVVLRPYAGPDQSLVWVCGHAAAPAALEYLGSTADEETTVASQYLPSACR